MQAGSVVLLVKTDEEGREVQVAIERLEKGRRSVFAVEVQSWGK